MDIAKMKEKGDLGICIKCGHVQYSKTNDAFFTPFGIRCKKCGLKSTLNIMYKASDSTIELIQELLKFGVVCTRFLYSGSVVKCGGYNFDCDIEEFQSDFVFKDKETLDRVLNIIHNFDASDMDTSKVEVVVTSNDILNDITFRPNMSEFVKAHDYKFTHEEWDNESNPKMTYIYSIIERVYEKILVVLKEESAQE